MSMSYFRQGELNTRFFSYYGNTGDLFVDETLYPLTIKQALHRQLTVNGYERIIFYSYAEGAFFLDQKSKDLWHGRKEAEPEKPLFANKILKGHLKPKGQEEKETLSFTVSPTEMLRAAEHFMNDSEIATAIVFPNGIEAIKEFAAIEQGKVLDNFFIRVTEGTVNQILNPNIAIFLFNRSESEVESIFCGVEKESIKKYLLDFAVTTRHVIPSPNKIEIRNLLNYLRIHGNGKKKLKTDCTELEQISEMIARKIARNIAEKGKNYLISAEELQAFDLKGTLRFLVKNVLEKDMLLNMETCKRMCKKDDEPSALERLNGLIGMQAVKDAVNGFISLNKNKGMVQEFLPVSRLEKPKKRPDHQQINLHFALTGNKGTGKTTAAKLIGEILCENGFLSTGHTIVTSPGELIGDVIGASERNTRQAIERAMGGVLFIDEAYELANDNDYASSIVTQIVADMERLKGDFSLIIAGYPDRIEELMETNEGLKGRFADNWILIEDYTPTELTEIFMSMAKGKGMEISDALRELLPNFFQNWYYAKRLTEWANAREVENLLGSMRKKCTNDVLTPELIPDKLKQYTSNEAEENAMAQLSSMVGLKTVKVEIENMLRYAKFKKECSPRHFLFSGNPGTGKTTVAAILGKVLKNIGVLKKGHVVRTLPRELIAGYVGQTAEKARKVFESALDGVLFIDEAYGLLPGSGGSGEKDSDFGGAVMNLLLEYTDPENNKPISFICAGYEKEMESFLAFNQGLARRFQVIHFDNYTAEELRQILEIQMKKNGYNAEQGYLESACNYFRKNIEIIAKKYNGGYVSQYLRKSEDKMFKRLWEKYPDEKVPEEELHMLKAEDAPD